LPTIFRVVRAIIRIRIKIIHEFLAVIATSAQAKRGVADLVLDLAIERKWVATDITRGDLRAVDVRVLGNHVVVDHVGAHATENIVEVDMVAKGLAVGANRGVATSASDGLHDVLLNSINKQDRINIF